MTEIAALEQGFLSRGFITSNEFSTALQLVMALQKPLLIEGPAGVGKTESAKVLADVLGTRLIRLQCYEGLDASSALYEWNYPRQMLRIRMTENEASSLSERESQIFSEAGRGHVTSPRTSSTSGAFAILSGMLRIVFRFAVMSSPVSPSPRVAPLTRRPFS